MPIAHGGVPAINDPLPSHSVLGCSGHSGPGGPLLFKLCFSVSPPTVARLASLSLPLRVPGKGLACGAGCWLPEGVSDPAPLPLRYLLGHWFLSRSLPQIFISDLLLPLDFVDAPQTGVEECLNLLLHRLCCPPCLTSVEQDWLHIGVEGAEFDSYADSSRCPDVSRWDSKVDAAFTSKWLKVELSKQNCPGDAPSMLLRCLAAKKANKILDWTLVTHTHTYIHT